MTNIFIRSSINDFEMTSAYDEMENSTSLYDEMDNLTSLYDEIENLTFLYDEIENLTFIHDEMENLQLFSFLDSNLEKHMTFYDTQGII